MNISDEKIIEWNNNRLYNPITKRKIKDNGPTYKKFFKKFLEYKNKIKSNNCIDKYKEYRKNKIDPLLHEELPLYENLNENDLFIFKYKWNPYIGEREEIDPNGPLYFDPDTLIHYFYVNRLNNLWITSDNNFQGYYGDALGNGPNFYIEGRGDYRNWYLFRLPIPDCYLYNNHNYQTVTMGPILSNNEIKLIYRKAKRYKNKYYELYHKKRPNLIKLKLYYDNAISKNPLSYDQDILNELNNIKYIKDAIYQENIKNVFLLSKL